MNFNECVATESKKKINSQSVSQKKENLLDIKQNLYQELTTQSSLKLKYRDNDESSKYINYFNLKNNEDNVYSEFKLNKENKKTYNKFSIEKNKENFFENKNYSENSKIKSLNEKKVITQTQNNSKQPIQNKNLFNNSFLNLSNNSKNFKNNKDLIYIITPNKNKNNKESEKQSEPDNSDNQIAHLVLPFCHYHKYNLGLPKQYTCNFKNCSCCAFQKKINNSQVEKDSNNYKNKKDFIYPKFDSEKKNNKNKYRSVLDQFKKNNLNINMSNSQITGESNDLDDSSYIFMKPNNINLKISKNDYITENESENLDNSNDNNSQGFNNSKSNDESSKLELPFDLNNDEKDLKKYKNLVNKSDKKSKIHFSIEYYKRLNKSYKQIYSKDIKNDPINDDEVNPLNKIKNIELLRE